MDSTKLASEYYAIPVAARQKVNPGLRHIQAMAEALQTELGDALFYLVAYHLWDCPATGTKTATRALRKLRVLKDRIVETANRHHSITAHDFEGLLELFLRGSTPQGVSEEDAASIRTMLREIKLSEKKHWTIRMKVHDLDKGELCVNTEEELYRAGGWKEMQALADSLAVTLYRDCGGNAGRSVVAVVYIHCKELGLGVQSSRRGDN